VDIKCGSGQVKAAMLINFKFTWEKWVMMLRCNDGARVVKDLTRNIVGKGYNLYFDNLFNSVGLQKDLQDDVI
jgi:hypothetical protein